MVAHNKGKGKCIAWLREHVTFDGSDCLIWPFARDFYGYGQFGADGETTNKPHRWMCEQINGPAPSSDYQAGHECGNGHLGCVHPKHLFWKTAAENAQDKAKHGTMFSCKGQARRKLTPSIVAEIRARASECTFALAEQYGVCESTIRKIRYNQIWLPTSRRIAELTPEQVNIIRDSKGLETAKTLAAKFGIKPNAVYKIWSGESFAYVPRTISA